MSAKWQEDFRRCQWLWLWWYLRPNREGRWAGWLFLHSTLHPSGTNWIIVCYSETPPLLVNRIGIQSALCTFFFGAAFYTFCARYRPFPKTFFTVASRADRLVLNYKVYAFSTSNLYPFTYITIISSAGSNHHRASDSLQNRITDSFKESQPLCPSLVFFYTFHTHPSLKKLVRITFTPTPKQAVLFRDHQGNLYTWMFY